MSRQTQRLMAVPAVEFDRRGTLPLEGLERVAMEAGAITPALARAFRMRAERAAK